MTRTARPPKKSRLQNAIVGVQVFVCFASLIAVAFAVAPATDDVFRFPKNLWVRGETIVLLATWLIALLYGIRPTFTKADRPVLALAGAAVGWTWLSAVFATNRLLSLNAALWTTAIAMIYLTMYLIARDRRRLGDLWLLLGAAAVNAGVAISQSAAFWNPFDFAPGTTRDQMITAFVGNPNELGAYLTVPFVVASCLMVSLPGRRWLYGITAFICICGLFASRTRSAMLAAIVGGFCLIAIASKRRVWAAAVIVAGCALIAAVVFFGGFVTTGDLQRFRTIDGLNAGLSYRVTPTLTAIRMFEDHPLLGVGPGVYSFEYFDYKIKVESEHPALFHRGQGYSNFGEAHDDHAQVLAELGLPGYLIFLAIFVWIASRSFRATEDRDDIDHVVRLMAFPVAAALFALCVFQFPLRVASSAVTVGFVLISIAGWTRQ